MFVFLPITVDEPIVRRPIASIVIGAVLAYHFILSFVFAGQSPFELDLAYGSGWELNWETSYVFLLSLLRGPLSITIPFILLFWILLAPPMEDKMGTLKLCLLFLAGGILPIWMAKIGIFQLGDSYWAGLGGLLFLMGAGYKVLFETDIKGAYVYFVFYRFGSGTTDTGAIFWLAFLHLLLSVAPLNPFAPAETAEVEGFLLSEVQWRLFFPFIGLGLIVTLDLVQSLFTRKEDLEEEA